MESRSRLISISATWASYTVGVASLFAAAASAFVLAADIPDDQADG